MFSSPFFLAFVLKGPISCDENFMLLELFYESSKRKEENKINKFWEEKAKLLKVIKKNKSKKERKKLEKEVKENRKQKVEIETISKD